MLLSSTVDSQSQRERAVATDRSGLLQFVAERGHGALHALVLLPLALQHRRLGLHLLDDLVQHSAHPLGLLLLQLQLRLALRIRVVELDRDKG